MRQQRILQFAEMSDKMPSFNFQCSASNRDLNKYREDLSSVTPRPAILELILYSCSLNKKLNILNSTHHMVITCYWIF
jgi:hypothetical protein